MQELRISLPGADVAQGGRAVRDLATFLERSLAGASTRIERSSPDTQDLGTTLVLLAGTPAALAIAKGISAWLVKAGRPAIEISTGKKRIVIEKGLSDEATREIVLKALDASSRD